jgi:aspartyl-tRNA(Asn)/glutamyl-tRNA(Gln) amidotransferase subunit A
MAALTTPTAEPRPSGAALCYASIAEVARLIATKALSPVELMRMHLDRIAELDSKLCSFITVLPERALEEARAAEREIAAGRNRGALHGVPYSLKDNTAASRVFWDRVPDVDATIHARLVAAGGILLGKNNTWEFGTGTGEMQPDLPHPPARNPWDLSCFAAGSSTGTGAAVAAGLAMFGMGSDTGGSVRAPSACNGLFGLKPTYGRLSRAGILPNSFSFDAAGPLVRRVEDAALVMQAIAGRDPRDPTSSDAPVPDYAAALDHGVKGLRIGVIRRFHERDVEADAEVVAALENSLDTLRRLGATLVELDVPYSVQDYRLLVRLVGQAEALSIHAEDFRERHGLMGPALRDKCLASLTVSALDFVAATRWRQQMMLATDAAIVSCDAVICGANLHRVPRANDEAGRIAYMLGSATCCFNVSGHPAASICTGYDSRGLPMAMQIVGKYFDEATVLRVAAAYESATEWHHRHPTFAESPPAEPTTASAPAMPSARAPAREEVAAILRRMGVRDLDDAMIDRATALAAATAAQIERLPASLPRELDSAHILALPRRV